LQRGGAAVVPRALALSHELHASAADSVELVEQLRVDVRDALERHRRTDARCLARRPERREMR